jgi:hypothetical protein
VDADDANTNVVVIESITPVTLDEPLQVEKQQ